jgi:hypothetical protein
MLSQKRQRRHHRTRLPTPWDEDNFAAPLKLTVALPPASS